MSKDRPGKHRLSMDIPQRLFELMKESSSENNMTITQWLLEAIVRKLKKEFDRDKEIS